MRSPPRRTAALILLLLIPIAIWWRQMEKVEVPSSIRQTSSNRSSMSSPQQSSVIEDNEPPPPRGKRPELPKRESGTEDQGQVIASSAVHTRIPAGHSMVTGGYQMENGHKEFVVLTPKWLETPSGKKQIMLESRILNVDQEALLSTGLDSLVTGEQILQQNAEVWTPDDVTRTLTDTKGLDLLSAPSIVVTPGQSGQILIGSAKDSFILDLEANEAPDGGFELKSEIKRVK